MERGGLMRRRSRRECGVEKEEEKRGEKEPKPFS